MNFDWRNRTDTQRSSLVARAEVLFTRLLHQRTSIRALVAITFPALLLASALLVGPGQVFSTEVTWDVMFNLDGAWRIASGQIPHLDFHTELGFLPFLMTRLGFYFTGPDVLAVPLSECALSAVVLLMCVAVLRYRLPLAPAVLCSILCSWLILLPSNYGEVFRVYSLAAPYNRFGWSLISLLLVLFFVRRSDDSLSSWSDYIISFLILSCLYYIKITYFVVGIAALALTAVLPVDARQSRKGWLAVLICTILLAGAPFNHPYLTDILVMTRAGGAHNGFPELVAHFVADPQEYTLGLMGFLLLATAPVISERARWINLSYGGFVLLSGPLLLSQNAQTHGIASYIVFSFLLYVAVLDQTRDRWTDRGNKFALLLALLIYPAVTVTSFLVELVHYRYTQSSHGNRILHVSMGQIHRLHVPDDLAIRAERAPGVARAVPDSTIRRFELTQQEYIDTLKALASLWHNQVAAGGRPRIMILERVNPIPIILGTPPPKGIDLWWGDHWGNGLIDRDAEQIFADADYVAVPRRATQQSTVCDLVAAYGEYLAVQFRVWQDTRDWLVLQRRQNADLPLAESAAPLDASVLMTEAGCAVFPRRIPARS